MSESESLETAVPENFEQRKKIEAELKRLEAKRAEVSDKDIRAALDLAIKGRQSELDALGGPLKLAPTPNSLEPGGSPSSSTEEAAPIELPEAPTPAALEQAEKLIQQARLEHRRQNTTRAAELLDEALRVAPGASSVQETVGDDFSERKQWKAALSRYDLARKLDPKNVSAEKKHADLVFKTKAAAATAELSLEYARDQMVGSAQKAAIFSFFLPGSGQIVLGENTFGGIAMGLWALLVFWVFLWRDDLYGVVYNLGLHTKSSTPPIHPPNYGVLIPVFGALLIHVITVFSAAAEGASVKLVRVAHPEPPVSNLPFE